MDLAGLVANDIIFCVMCFVLVGRLPIVEEEPVLVVVNFDLIFWAIICS
jgi:hypothetical protein